MTFHNYLNNIKIVQIYISVKHSIVIFLTFEIGTNFFYITYFIIILFYFEKGFKDIVMYVTSG